MTQLPVPEPLRGTLRHTMPGRSRIVLEPPLPVHSALTHLAERLAAVPGVETVEIRPTTGSLVLRHAGAIAALLPALVAAGLVVGPRPPTEPIDPIADAVTGLGAADRTVGRMTGGRADLWSVAFAGLVGAGLVQLARGRVAGPALTLFSQAATLAMMRPFRMPKR
jgi:hypothetical protein